MTTHIKKRELNIRFEGEGTVAAEYFINDAKCEALGFVGNAYNADHLRRYREFSAIAKEQGITPESMLFSLATNQKNSFDDWIDHSISRKDEIRRFLGKLRKPAGIFCGDDNLAIRMYCMAEIMGIRVPEEMHILGIGSNSRSKAPWAHLVSVIQLNHHKLGYVAAKMMNEYLMTGKSPKPVILKPIGICHSLTTFRWTVDDSIVRGALMMIQQNPSVEVLTICEHYKLGRKAMDIRFRRVTNMTVAKAIELERFNQAKWLLLEKNYSLDAVAAMAGYPNRKGMRRSFQRFTQMSPQEIRNLSA
jgi:LacI family transcriptional regulator